MVILFLTAGVASAEQEASYFKPSHTRAFQADFLDYIDSSALLQKMADKNDKKIEFFLVDLRKEIDYRKGAIEGAVNVPLQKLSFLAEKLFSKTDDVVFYGYSGDHRAAINSVILLKNKGFGRVSFFKEGYEGWKKKTGPKES